MGSIPELVYPAQGRLTNRINWGTRISRPNGSIT